MREPLFRGVSKETNEWVYGFGWFKTDYTEEYLKELGKIEQAVLYTNRGPVLCYLDSMGEWTGLRDNKKTDEFPDGQMIFEGDIVKGFYDEYNTYFNETNRIEFISDVKWINNGFGVRRLTANYEGRLRDYGYQLFWDAENVEVIGNIYEDKHLLEGME